MYLLYKTDTKQIISISDTIPAPGTNQSYLEVADSTDIAKGYIDDLDNWTLKSDFAYSFSSGILTITNGQNDNLRITIFEVIADEINGQINSIIDTIFYSMVTGTNTIDLSNYIGKQMKIVSRKFNVIYDTVV